MWNGKVNRRDFLKLGGGTLAVAGAGVLGLPVAAQGEILKIRCQRNYSIGRYYYDPIALYVQPGQTVQWYLGRDAAPLEREGFSVVAYHPDNDNHELRIPEMAKPFDSAKRAGGDAFEWTFEVEGTYDFYSRGQEMIGMIGRIVVGKPGGPGEKPPGYGSREGRAPIFKEALRTFEVLKSEEIVRKKVIPYPVKELGRRFPMY